MTDYYAVTILYLCTKEFNFRSRETQIISSRRLKLLNLEK